MFTYVLYTYLCFIYKKSNIFHTHTFPINSHLLEGGDIPAFDVEKARTRRRAKKKIQELAASHLPPGGRTWATLAPHMIP